MTPRTRTVSRVGVASVTGVTTVAALAGTGWFTGQAAADLHTEQARRQAEQDASAAVNPQARHRGVDVLGSRARPAGPGPVVLRQRPTRTQVTYRYVPSSQVGTGGTVTTQSVVPAPAAPAAQSSAPAAQPPPAAAPQQQAAPAPAPPPTQTTPTTPSTAS